MAFKIDWEKLMPGWDENRHYPEAGELVTFEDGSIAIPIVFRDTWRCPEMMYVTGDFKGRKIKVPIEQQPYIRKDCDRSALRDYTELVAPKTKLRHYPGDIFEDDDGCVVLYLEKREEHGCHFLVLTQPDIWTYDYVGLSVYGNDTYEKFV